MTEDCEKRIPKILNNIRPTFTPGIYLLRMTKAETDILWAMYEEWKKRR